MMLKQNKRGAEQTQLKFPLFAVAPEGNDTASSRPKPNFARLRATGAGGPVVAAELRPQSCDHPGRLLPNRGVVYETALGAAYMANSLALLRDLPSKSADAVITSPPYALEFKKEYGNVDKIDYVNWLMPFAREIKRVLVKDGSFVLNIGGSYNPGQPTRSLYHFKLLIALCEEAGFHLAQECFWFNPAKLPTPAEWVNVRRFRVKDSVEYIWWLSPSARPYADNKQVLGPYSPDMKRLIEKGYKAKTRPSGHNITTKFNRDRGGSIP